MGIFKKRIMATYCSCCDSTALLMVDIMLERNGRSGHASFASYSLICQKVMFAGTVVVSSRS